MVCKKCGEELPDNAIFCSGCGTKIETDTSNATEQYAPAIPVTGGVQTPSAGTNVGPNGDMKPKNSLKWVIVALVVAIIAVAVIAVVFLGKDRGLFGNGSTDNNPTDSYNGAVTDSHTDDFGENDDAYLEYEDNGFVVRLEYNNGERSSKISMDEEGYIPEPTVPYREGYDFDGWYADEELNSKWDFENDKAYEEMTLYAKWVEIVTEEYADNEKLIIAGGGLRLRNKPTTQKSKVYLLIPNGTHIFVEKIEDGWAYTTYKKYSGWVSADFLFDPAEHEGKLIYYANVNSKGTTMTVDSDESQKVDVPAKEKVGVYKVDGKSAYIYYDGEYGWCPIKDLKEIVKR